MMRHSVSKQIVATTTTAAVGSRSLSSTAVLLAPATSLFSSLSAGSSRSYFTTSSLNVWESSGRRTTRLSSAATTTSPGAGGISPSVRSPILVGCAMACVATPLISVRNFSSNNNTTTPAGNHRFSISSPSISEGAPVPHSTEEAMKSWKVRAETAEKHLQELKRLLDRPANPSSRTPLHGDGSAKMQKHEMAEGEGNSSSDFAASIADDEAKRKKNKEKELEDAFKSIASGATKIFEEFTTRAHQSGCPAFQEDSGNNNSHWEEQAAKHCKHSHCRQTGKCHYGCQARHNYPRHGFHAKNTAGPRFNSKNFCKPIRHRRSLPTTLAMMGLAGLVVYGLGCLAMMVGTMLMVGAVIVPAVVVLGFYYVLNQESFFNSHCFWDGQEKKANQDTLLASSSDKATNTDWSLVCRK